MNYTKPWRSCRAESPDGSYLCTQRIYLEEGATHAGDHIAEGRAEGEPDSVIARWKNEAPANAESRTPQELVVGRRNLVAQLKDAVRSEELGATHGVVLEPSLARDLIEVLDQPGGVEVTDAAIAMARRVYWENQAGSTDGVAAWRAALEAAAPLLGTRPQPTPDDWPAHIDPEDGFNYSTGQFTGQVRDDAAVRPTNRNR